MIVATTLAATIAFAFGLRVLGLLEVSTAASATARAALTSLTDARLDDDARERAAREASARLFRATGAIVVRAAGCLALSAVPIALADRTGLARWADVNAFLLSWPGALTSLVAGSLALVPFRRS